MMRQQINLYLPEFRLKKDPLTTVRMLQMLAATAAVLLLITAFDLSTQWRLSRELEVLQLTLAEETRKTDELDDVLARRSQDTRLMDLLESAEARLQARRQIRNFFSQASLGNVEGFSEYLKDIARASSDGLSIDAFSINEGGNEVRLAGQVLDSAMVPRYVNNIERGQSQLRNLRFSSVISREDPENQFFTFVLNTTDE